ncbi:hypothetical protein TRFO_12510 [Tritrichomonas foetus]|uniref:Uncharacterized protein n=1 Tax=Tritrichomonas foetus TaxID=1144522 RepID=A0A1J4L1M7_9EUKA|nr:hypothetical protein TRFO_12510 [Tritrichomonas foetus]|eukprot:OHT17339.1 hypothetical protein TRFO_12510 [Tritrichomonas foetus]
MKINESKIYHFIDASVYKRGVIYSFIFIIIINSVWFLIPFEFTKIEFSKNIPLNALNVGPISYWSQPLYVISEKPIRQSSVGIITHSNPNMILIPKYGDYFHPTFKFWCINENFTLYFYPHNTENQNFLLIHNAQSSQFLFFSKIAILLVYIVLYFIKFEFSNNDKLLYFSFFLYNIQKMKIFHFSIPCHDFFQTFFFAIFMYFLIYKPFMNNITNEIFQNHHDKIIDYFLRILTFVVIILFYLSNRFIIFQQATFIVWLIFNLVYIFTHVHSSNSHSNKAYMAYNVFWALMILNSVFISSLALIHVEFFDQTFLFELFDLSTIITYLLSSAVIEKKIKMMTEFNEMNPMSQFLEK